MPAANMMSGKLVDTFRQAKAPSEKRKAVLRSASKEAKPEAVAAAHQAPSDAGKLPVPERGARCGALGVCAACAEEGCTKAEQTCDAGCPPEDEREALRQFDLTGRYGPCTGLTRLERCALRLPSSLQRWQGVDRGQRPLVLSCPACMQARWAARCAALDGVAPTHLCRKAQEPPGARACTVR